MIDMNNRFCFLAIILLLPIFWHTQTLALNSGTPIQSGDLAVIYSDSVRFFRENKEIGSISIIMFPREPTFFSRLFEGYVLDIYDITLWRKTIYIFGNLAGEKKLVLVGADLTQTNLLDIKWRYHLFYGTYRLAPDGTMYAVDGGKALWSIKDGQARKILGNVKGPVEVTTNDAYARSGEKLFAIKNGDTKEIDPGVDYIYRAISLDDEDRLYIWGSRGGRNHLVAIQNDHIEEIAPDTEPRELFGPDPYGYLYIETRDKEIAVIRDGRELGKIPVENLASFWGSCVIYGGTSKFPYLQISKGKEDNRPCYGLIFLHKGELIPVDLTFDNNAYVIDPDSNGILYVILRKEKAIIPIIRGEVKEQLKIMLDQYGYEPTLPSIYRSAFIANSFGPIGPNNTLYLKGKIDGKIAIQAFKHGRDLGLLDIREKIFNEVSRIKIVGGNNYYSFKDLISYYSDLIQTNWFNADQFERLTQEIINWSSTITAEDGQALYDLLGKLDNELLEDQSLKTIYMNLVDLMLKQTHHPLRPYVAGRHADLIYRELYPYMTPREFKPLDPEAEKVSDNFNQRIRDTLDLADLVRIALDSPDPWLKKQYTYQWESFTNALIQLGLITSSEELTEEKIKELKEKYPLGIKNDTVQLIDPELRTCSIFFCWIS